MKIAHFTMRRVHHSLHAPTKSPTLHCIAIVLNFGHAIFTIPSYILFYYVIINMGVIVSLLHSCSHFKKFAKSMHMQLQCTGEQNFEISMYTIHVPFPLERGIFWCCFSAHT